MPTSLKTDTSYLGELSKSTFNISMTKIEREGCKVSIQLKQMKEDQLNTSAFANTHIKLNFYGSSFGMSRRQIEMDQYTSIGPW